MNSVALSLAAFSAAATVLTITPGLDTALILRTAFVGNVRGAAFAGLGIAVGCFCWASLVALGLGVVWTGYKMLRHPRQSFAVRGESDKGIRGAFATGALTNLLNPKVGIFYVSFLPQFVPNGISVAPYILLLGALHALLGLIWFACLILATRPISGFLSRPATVNACDRLTGGIFMAFGVGLALGSRRA